MVIDVNMGISQVCIDKINEYNKTNGSFPTKIFLNSTQYRDLWIETFYTWTRELNEPHVLKEYCGCEIKIHFDDVIKCSK